jgi:hypothetical protein
MILTKTRMVEFFPSDNRYLHYVARKNGLFFINDDDVESARFFAIEAVMRLVTKEVEYEDEKHLQSVVQMNVLRAIYRMIEWNSAKKNSQDIRSESEFIGSDDDGFSTYIELAESDDKPYDNTMAIIEEYAQEVLDDIGYAVYQMTLSDVARKEMSRTLGISPEAIRQRQKSNIKKLKLKYDTDENDQESFRENRRKIRNRIRRKPIAKNKATECASAEANAFLHTQYEIPYSLSNFE